MHAREWNEGDFPKRLRRARQKAGLTQAELAEHLDTRQFTVSRIESGRKPRNPLISRVISFIEESERPEMKSHDEVVSAIARSDELKALIARIAAEI